MSLLMRRLRRTLPDHLTRMVGVQVLGLSFRARELTLVAAGMAPVKVTGVENVDFRSLVSAHTDYAANMADIVDLLGFAEQ